MAYPEEFINQRRPGYLIGRALVFIGHIAVALCILAFFVMLAFGNPNAGISGVPLGLSLLFYIWGNGFIQQSHKSWLQETGQAPVSNSWMSWDSVRFLILIAILVGSGALLLS